MTDTQVVLVALAGLCGTALLIAWGVRWLFATEPGA